MRYEQIDMRRDSVSVFHSGSRLHMPQTPPCGGRIKRLFDLVFASCALIFLSPLMIGVALMIRLSDGGPAFFGHTRIGYNGKSFTCLKFRSMKPNSDAELQRHLSSNSAAMREWQTFRKVRNDPRVTPLGQILRKSSIDELPQLFNILVGDMSVVGPRPIQSVELQKYGSSRRHYLRSRPGLTGLWQVSGRSDLSYERRVALDRYYVTHSSLRLDIWVILKTVAVVMGRKGSY